MRAYDWISHQSARVPEQRAVLDLGSGDDWTYADFDTRIDRVAQGLRSQCGVAAGDRVALLMPNCGDVLTVQFACYRLGAIFVPLNWRLAVRELAFIAKNAEPRVLLGHTDFAATLEGLEAELPELRVLRTGEGAKPDAFDTLTQAAGEFPVHEASLDDIAALVYTSGTSGLPKGVLLTHRMQLFNAVNLAVPARITIDSCQLVVLPLFHTGGLNCYTNVMFHVGGSVVLMGEWDPVRALAALQDPALQITHFFGVPTHYQTMGSTPGFERASLDHIVNAGVGGAPVPGPILEQWQGKGVPMQQGYGLTETSPTATVLDTARATAKLGSCGLPAMHSEVKLVDELGNEVTEPETVGEVWIRGPNVSPGYWRNPEATEKAFSPDGWLKSGDAAKRDSDGYYTIVDRWKDMFISGGENVYPAEVENAIYELDAVAEVAVIGVAHPRWGEVGRALVVVRAGATLTEDDVVTHCKAALAKYKVPKSVRFIDALPRNAAGKVLKRELKA